MTEAGMRNLTVMGESSTGGGKFEKMRVMGECEVHGDLDTGSCRVVGECAVYGDMTCGYFKNMGEVTIDGSLAVKQMNLMGQTMVGKQCYVKKGTIYGELICKHELSGDTLKIGGMLRGKENVSLESLDIKGGIHVDGLLNCGSLNIVLKFDSDNYVREIGAGSVRVKKRHSFFHRAPLRNFQSDIIEGDDIHIEYTTARIVRGTRVFIGSGCKVERVEYTETYDKGMQAEVGHAVRTAGSANDSENEEKKNE